MSGPFWSLSNTIGRLSSIKQGDFEIYYGYTPDGRIAAEVHISSEYGGIIMIEYEYDLNGNLTRLSYPISGQVVNYQFNGLDVDRVSEVKVGNSIFISNITYNFQGQPLSWSAGELRWTTEELEGRGIGSMRLEKNGDIYFALNTPTNSFNQAGHALRVEDEVAPEKTVEYTYEPTFGRIRSENRGDASGILSEDLPYVSATWEYDLAGNRTETSIDGVLSTYTYYPGTNRINSEPSAESYKYLDGGQVDSRDYEYFNYDELGRLYTYRRFYPSIPGSNSVAPNSMFYKYDFNGRRIESRWGFMVPMSLPTNFWYSQAGELLEVMEPGVDPRLRDVWDYIYLNDRLIGVVRGTSEASFDHVGKKFYFIRYKEKNRYYVFPGHLGQPLVAVSADHQKLAWKAEYSAFGLAKIDPIDIKIEARSYIENIRKLNRGRFHLS